MHVDGLAQYCPSTVTISGGLSSSAGTTLRTEPENSIFVKLSTVPRQKSVNTFAVLAEDMYALHLLNFLVLSRLFPLVAMRTYRKF
jgi:hypothetical protein